jgi:hypothetical protein
MDKKNSIKKGVILGLSFLLISITFAPYVCVVSKSIDEENIIPLGIIDDKDEKSVTCYIFDKTGNSQREVTLTADEFESFHSKFYELNNKITYSPFSSETDDLKLEIAYLLDKLGLIPEDCSREDVIRLMNPSVDHRRRPLFSLMFKPVMEGRGYASFCNYATFGEGSQFPVIIFPRLIPIIQLPIPRVFMRWSAIYGITSCGGLLSGKGFIAEGAQQGFALGFWGIGFSVFLPPIMSFGFIGYALFSTATAENIIPWPPNRPPVVLGENPPDGTVDVPVDLPELSFSLSDFDGDIMNYTVTTNPYIGGDSRQNVNDGDFSFNIFGLESDTEYSWTVHVSDRHDTTEETFTFHTAIEAPIISNPIPVDGDSWVSVDLPELSIRFEDLQGDPMDYTIETSPDIGSGSGNGVGNGVYTVTISDLEYTHDYTWFVNVTDGMFWVRKTMNFKTQPIMQFNPYELGWSYRKKITIDHTQVSGDFSDFPVLISITDSDLASKAQYDGDDILFVDSDGVANRLFHEIELFDNSSLELVSWVNIPHLTEEEDYVLYLYYGNSDCGNQEYPDFVWDSNYVSVWHMDGNNFIEFEDSTSNGFDATNDIGNPTYQQPSKIGYGVEFDGIDDQIHICDDDKFSFCDSSGDKPCSFEAWIKTEEPEATIITKFTHGDTGEWFFFINADNKCKLWFRDSIGEHCMYRDTSDDVTNNTWIYVSSTFDGGTNYQKITNYLNGVDNSGYGERRANYKRMRNKGEIVRFGMANYGRYFDGIIDEVRISNVERSPEWIKTSYKTMNNPSNFFSVDPEETAP